MAKDFVRFELTDRNCRTFDDEVFEGYDYFAIFILFLIVLMVGVGTAYHYATRARSGPRNVLLMAFSATRNMKRLFDKRVLEGALPAVDGVRVLSLLWIVCCHALFIAGHLPVANADRIPDYLNYGYMALIGSAFLSVDTFLVMSGMLASYVYLRRSSTGRSVNLIGYYLHRILRLSPSLGLVMFLQSTILLKLRDGPVWRLQPAQQCSETWWYILLHICNYFRPDTVQCMVHLWYLSLDWQLYVLAPLALFWFKRRPRRVLASMLFLGIAGIVVRFWVAYSGDHVTPWGGHYSRRTMEAVYFPTHMRFVPYLMGLALGYEIHRVKHLKYPPTFSQSALSVMQVGWPLLLTGSIGWVHRHMGLESPPEPFTEALHIAFVDVTWAAGITMLLYLCAIGNGGPVGQMLSMGWWRPLGCLSYGVYLLHIPLYDSLIHDTRQLIRLDIWRLCIAGVECFFIVHIPAMALWLGVDAPLAYIVNSFSNPPKGEKKKQSNNVLSSGEKWNMDFIEISNGEPIKGKNVHI